MVRLPLEQRDDSVELPVRQAELAMERLFRDGAQNVSLAAALDATLSADGRRNRPGSVGGVNRHRPLLLLLASIGAAEVPAR